MNIIPKKYGLSILLILLLTACHSTNNKKETLLPMNHHITASQIIGNPDYQAISYGGYRDTTRDSQPTIQQLKNDMRILAAMDIKVIRTYNTQYEKAGNVLKAIRELRAEDPSFEMYVMLGAWIDCEHAWSDVPPNHAAENLEANTAEIERAVGLAARYPEIVKFISVGNEARVRWAESYYVQTDVILKWVNYLQDLKQKGQLDKDLWITSSDNFASWGGGDSSYHGPELEALIRAVDFVSLHTYPMHDTHYNPVFWGTMESEMLLATGELIERVMERTLLYAKKQYFNTRQYVHSIAPTKPVHIGESGWASKSANLYGMNGSKACDEYKQGVYYRMMRKWTNEEHISCFYFQAFDEKWKDTRNPNGSENNFGLFKINGEAKYALWDLVDQGVFEGMTRDSIPIRKTYGGNLDSLLQEVELPPMKQLI